MTGSPRPRLVVLFGGRSAEHDVSCVTATHVLRAVDRERYDIVPVGISRDGSWSLAEGALEALEGGALPRALEATGPAVDALPLLVGETSGPAASDQTVALPLLHGPFGEDGTVQGLLELADVPYVGSGVLGSALAMDKAKAKEVCAQHGIPQSTHLSFRADTVPADLVDVVGTELGFPAFVKPANMGSSVGVSRVTNELELREAVELALSYDEWIVLEEEIVGREIELAVLGNVDLQVSVPGEIVPGEAFYSYEDKYVTDGAQLLIPAPLEDDEVRRFQELARAAFVALRCEGMGRVDFLYEEGGRGPLLNEVNTIPGFTPISMFPKLWAASGLAYPDLIDELIRLAIERHQRRTKRTPHQPARRLNTEIEPGSAPRGRTRTTSASGLRCGGERSMLSLP